MSSPNTLLRYLPISLRVLIGLALVAGAGLAARSWLASHDAATQLRATLAAQAKNLQNAAASQQERDKTLAKTLTGITAAKSAVKTAAQAAAQIPQVLPSLPDPINIELPPPSPQPPQSESPVEPAPDFQAPAAPAPALATIPQADLKPLYDYLQDCRACQAQLAAAKGDLDDERRKTAALTQERDAAVHAARGTFWSRLGHSAKWALIGGAIAAVAIAASPRKSP